MKTIYEEFSDDSQSQEACKKSSRCNTPTDRNNNLEANYCVELNHNVAGGEQQPRQNTKLQNKATEKEAGAASVPPQPGQSPKLPNVSLVTLRDPAKVRASLYTPNRKR